jgi:PKD repeat protein
VIEGIAERAGVYRVVITARNQGGQTSGTLTIHVTSSSPSHSKPPVIISPERAVGILQNVFGYTIVTNGEATSYDAVGLPPGLSVNASSGVIFGTPEVAGVFQVKLIASNSAGSTSKYLTLTINVPGLLPSLPPEVIFRPSKSSQPSSVGRLQRASPIRGRSVPPQSSGSSRAGAPVSPSTGDWSVGSLSAALGGVSNSSADAGKFNLESSPNTASALKKGVEKPNEKEKSGEEKKEGDISKTASGTSDLGSKEEEKKKDAPALPLITSPSRVTGNTGREIIYVINTASQADEFSVEGELPDGLRLDEGAGGIRGVPSKSGSYRVVVRASNSAGDSQKEVTFSIVSMPAPVIVSESVKGGYLGVPFSYEIRATGGPTSFEVEGELPDGLRFDAQRGRIFGTPEREMSSLVRIVAVNGTGRDQKDLRISIKVPPPEIKTVSALVAEVGSGFEQRIETDQEIIAYRVEGSLPEGMRFDKSTGILSGTAVKEGNYSFVVQAINTAGTATKRFTLRVNPRKEFQIFMPKSVRGKVDQLLRFQIQVNMPARRFTVVGKLPDGVTLNSESGEVRGVPLSSGIFEVVVRAESEKGTAEGSLKIIIDENKPRKLRERSTPDNLNELISDEKPVFAWLNR